ncbi:tetratricopeptide repeat-containing sensor histidine kinase [Niabella insulamsoli]|uniref:tetratricopeptide repeat-containing sensor histidine kinase n=1 Tax=Niabella insulamsoli TaxID=3144874 RepID=UPI0031FD1809
MKGLSFNLTLICLIFSFNSFSQTFSSADDVARAVKQIAGYREKVALLQNEINKIYLTRYDETIDLARLGYELAKNQHDNVNKGNFLRLIGGALGKKGSIDSASVYYYKALGELEDSGDSEKLGLLYDDMARLYRKLRQPERALSFYDKALSLYEAENNLEGIARINNESGVVYRDEGDYQTANKRFEKSLSIQRQRNDSVGIGYSLEFLGYTQMAIKNYSKAEAYLKQALKIRQRQKDQFALMLSYTALGEYYKETHQLAVSTSFFKKSNEVAQKIKFLDIQKYNHQQITDNYASLGDYKQAYTSFKIYNQLEDSLYNVQKLKDVEEMATKYEAAEKERKILSQRAKIAENELHLRKRNLWIFGLVSLAVIVGLIGFLLYKQQVVKALRQKQEGELKLALAQIDGQHKLQEQRLSISRDLHDNIGAQLSFIVSAIDTIKYYTSDKNEKFTDSLNNIRSFTKDTIQELRDTIWAMNKQSISLSDLRGRISNFVEKANQSISSVKMAFNNELADSDEIAFPSRMGMHIHQVLQEAVNNAMKHSGANDIWINFTFENDQFCFLVKDNGNGFDVTKNYEGNGLINMRKRAEILGGSLHITRDASLTSVRLMIPSNA